MKINFATAKPRQIEAYLREQVRKILGNEVEDMAAIYSSHGYYDCEVTVGKQVTWFQNFRKTEVPKIVKALKALK